MPVPDPTALALLNTIDGQRTAILATVASLTPDQRTWRHTPSSWSAVDVIEHLVLAEQVVLGDLASAAERPESPRRLRHRLRGLLVWLVLRVGVRVSVPAEAMRPSGGASFEALQATWHGQHRDLRALAERLGTAGLRRRIFRHPIAGPLSVLQALRLLSAHLETHRRQLERINKARQLRGKG